MKDFLTLLACKMAYLHCIMIQSVRWCEWNTRWQCEWGFSCGRLWSLSSVCCTGLHPPGWTGQSPSERGLPWNWSPLEGSKRNATRSQPQALKYYMLSFKGLSWLTINASVDSTNKHKEYQGQSHSVLSIFVRSYNTSELVFSTISVDSCKHKDTLGLSRCRNFPCDMRYYCNFFFFCKLFHLS